MNDSIEQRQVNIQIWILVIHLLEHAADREGDRQFLLTLPHRGLLLYLPRLHFAAYEFPQQPSGLAGWTLAVYRAMM